MSNLMRYFALATDYDGTLAEAGAVHPDTLKALMQLRESGRRVILVTGRELPDLMAVFPEYRLFDRIVAENGALLYDPALKRETVLAHAPPAEFARALARKGVSPLIVARVLVATLEDQKEIVLETIQELGLELQMIFNKGSLMVVPSGVNKATGLKAALQSLYLSLHNAVGVGDAENDHALLDSCERGVAVSNALPSLKQASDWVTTGSAGEGVSELIQRLIDDDLASIPAKDQRDAILVGEASGREVRIPYGTTALVADALHSATTNFVIAVAERLTGAAYQFCAIVAERDYETLEGAVVLGNGRIPVVDEMLNVLQDPKQNLLVNIGGIAAEKRRAFFESMLPAVQEMRARTGRPHWMILNESCHSAPDGALIVTSHPDRVPKSILAELDAVIGLGAKANETIKNVCAAAGEEYRASVTEQLTSRQGLLWSRKSSGNPVAFTVITTSSARRAEFSSLPPRPQTPG